MIVQPVVEPMDRFTALLLRTAATRVVRCLAGAGRRHPGRDNSGQGATAVIWRSGHHLHGENTTQSPHKPHTIGPGSCEIFLYLLQKYIENMLVLQKRIKDHKQINVVFQMYNFVSKTSLASTCNVMSKNVSKLT